MRKVQAWPVFSVVEHQPAHHTKGSQVHVPPPSVCVWEATSQYISHMHLTLESNGKRYPQVRIDIPHPPKVRPGNTVCSFNNCCLNDPPRLKPSNDSHSQTIKKSFNLLFNFWGTVYKFMVPELKCWIFNQLNEGNK